MKEIVGVGLTERIRTLFNRARIGALMLTTLVVRLTCCSCRNTSRPIVTMTTAAMFTPAAPQYICVGQFQPDGFAVPDEARTAMVIVSMHVANSALYQGTILSTSRPTRGDNDTPTAPTRPNSLSIRSALVPNDGAMVMLTRLPASSSCTVNYREGT